MAALSTRTGLIPLLIFGLDVRTSDATHPHGGYKEMYYLCKKAFSGKQGRLWRRFKSGLGDLEGRPAFNFYWS